MKRQKAPHPLRMTASAFGFLFRQQRLLLVFAMGTPLTFTTSIRIPFPAIATETLGGARSRSG